MEKFMRNAPTWIVLVVMALQIPRVSEFGVRIGARWLLAVVFALFLMFSIFVLSFFQGRTANYLVTASAEDKKAYTAQKKIKELFDSIHFTATAWLLVFVALDGFLNLAETMSNLSKEVAQFSWQWWGAGAYGLVPTLGAYGMGHLQALVSKMPGGALGASGIERIFNAWMRRMENALNADASDANASTTHKTQDAPKVKRNANAYPKACPHCGEMQASSNAYSAHIRWKHGTQSASQIGFVAQPVNKTATTTSEVGADSVNSVK